MPSKHKREVCKQENHNKQTCPALKLSIPAGEAVAQKKLASPKNDSVEKAVNAHKCGNCKIEGHNIRTCEAYSIATEKDNQSEKKGNARNKCSNCKIEGHNIRTCEANSIATEKENQSEKKVNGVKTDPKLNSIAQVAVKKYEEESESISRDNKSSTKNHTGDGKISINRSKPHSNKYIRDTDEVLKHVGRRLSENDGPGYIYMYKLDENNQETKLHNLKGCYKIGMSKKPPGEQDTDSIRYRTRRIQVQESKNKEKYQVLYYVPVAWRWHTEKVIHLQLKDRQMTRDVQDGKTEWFKGDLEEESGIDETEKIRKLEKKFKEVILYSKKIVQAQWPGYEPKEGL